MREAGVEVTSTRYDGQIHAFYNFAEMIDRGGDAVAELLSDPKGTIRLDPLAAKDVVAWLRKVASNERAASASRGQAVVKLTMLRRIAAIGKLRHAVPAYLRAWFGQPSPRPLVIFAFHKQVIWGVTQICDELGLKIATISGKDSDIKRQRAVDLFMSGKADVFIAPIRSAGVGLNLQRASDVLFLERLWTPALLTQAEDRVFRLGQTRQVTITYLDAAGTVDEYLGKVLSEKQRLIDQVVDGRQFDRQNIIETIDEVMARVAEVAPPQPRRTRRLPAPPGRAAASESVVESAT